MIRLYMIGGFVAIGGMLYAVDEHDKATNYRHVIGQVVSDTAVCHLKKVSYGLVKTTKTTRDGPCGIVREIAAEPDFKDFDLVKTDTVSYRYESPIDHNYYSGTYTTTTTNENTTLAVGQDVKILAHNKKPGKSRRDI